MSHGGPSGCTFTGPKERCISIVVISPVIPKEIAAEPIGDDEVHLFESRDHHRNWVDCMKSREKPVADVEVGARSVTVCHLLNWPIGTASRTSTIRKTGASTTRPTINIWTGNAVIRGSCRWCSWLRSHVLLPELFQSFCHLLAVRISTTSARSEPTLNSKTLRLILSP